MTMTHVDAYRIFHNYVEQQEAAALLREALEVAAKAEAFIATSADRKVELDAAIVVAEEALADLHARLASDGTTLTEKEAANAAYREKQLADRLARVEASSKARETELDATYTRRKTALDAEIELLKAEAADLRVQASTRRSEAENARREHARAVETLASFQQSLAKVGR